MATQQAKKRKRKKVLSIFDYYLTFIHYFGFSINPTDVNSHYLSIRIKRNLDNNSNQDNKLSSVNNNNNNNNIWLASYKERARHVTFGIVPVVFVSILKKFMKFVAISLTTFITLNHFLVLIHYVADDSKLFIEMLLEVRLVCTKLSALIFVLFWHNNQTKVRKLIKLIKSTSIYILGTFSNNQSLSTTLSRKQPELHLETNTLSSCGGNKFHQQHEFDDSINWNSHHHRRRNGLTTGSDQLDSLLKQNKLKLDTNRNIDDDDDDDESSNEEVGDLLHSNNSKIERRILNWWIMCICVTIAHFSLSELEITTDSSHLWDWVEDYSFHYVSNRTISRSTLMFLATFDNYIYTVHVYGTRLIGASIICIVCSLQRENILSLKGSAIQRLIQSKSSSSCNQSSSNYLNFLDSNLPATLRRRFAIGNNDIVCGFSSTEKVLPNKSWQCNDNYFSRFKPEGTGGDKVSSKQQQQQQSRTSCFQANMPDPRQELFFILSESNWINVRNNTRRLIPFGYLSSSLWFINHWFVEEILSYSINLIRNFSKRIYRALQNRFKSIGFHVKHNVVVVASDNGNLNNANLKSSKASTIAKSPEFKQVTPFPAVTLEQIADCAMNENQATKSSESRNNASNHHDNNLNQLFEPTPKGGRAPSSQLWAQQQQQHNSTGSDFCEENNAASMRHHLENYHLHHYYPDKYFPMNDDDDYDYQIKKKRRSNNFSLIRKDHNAIEWQLEKLANKYELIRTVNSRIDDCFGPMLFIQFSFLFLMSCIDLVYFSICFNPNTKTKFIIISGMILLWWPYLLLYKFASDIVSSSRELLLSVRRLARLSVIENHSSDKSGYENNYHYYCADTIRLNSPALFKQQAHFHSKQLEKDTSSRQLQRNDKHDSSSSSSSANRRAGIMNKLDHVFKPIHLSLMGMMTVDKFFLINFAKIVITASVMVIQFITN